MLCLVLPAPRRHDKIENAIHCLPPHWEGITLSPSRMEVHAVDEQKGQSWHWSLLNMESIDWHCPYDQGYNIYHPHFSWGGAWVKWTEGETPLDHLWKMHALNHIARQTNSTKSVTCCTIAQHFHFLSRSAPGRRSSPRALSVGGIGTTAMQPNPKSRPRAKSM